MPWRCPITAAGNWIAARRRWNWRRRVADAVGDRTEVYVDGGVRTGADIATAVGLGAKGCLIGRSYLCGLMGWRR